MRENLNALDLTELEYMKENTDYLHDFCLSSPQVLKIENLYEKSAELAKTLADENIAKETQIDDETRKNQELHYEFETKQDELKSLLNEYNKKK